MLVTKRDGREVPFCKEKIVDAISKARRGKIIWGGSSLSNYDFCYRK